MTGWRVEECFSKVFLNPTSLLVTDRRIKECVIGDPILAASTNFPVNEVDDVVDDDDDDGRVLVFKKLGHTCGVCFIGATFQYF